MSLSVTTEQVGGATVARLTGDLDRGADVPLAELEAGLAGRAGLVLDFGSTGFIASSGLALLVRLIRSAEAEGVAIAAVGLDDHYRHVFEITRLDQFIDLSDDEDAALAAVSGGNQ